MKVQGNSLQDLLASMMGSSVGLAGEAQLLGLNESGEEVSGEQLAEEFLGQLEQQGIDVSELLDQTSIGEVVVLDSDKSQSLADEVGTVSKSKNSKVLEQLLNSSQITESQAATEQSVNSSMSAQLKSILSKGNDLKGLQNKSDLASNNIQQVQTTADGQAASKISLGTQGDVLKLKMEGKQNAKNTTGQLDNLKVKNLDGEAAGGLLSTSDRPQVQVMMKSAMNSYMKNNGDAPVVKSQMKSFEETLNGVNNGNTTGVNGLTSTGQMSTLQSPAQNILNKASVFTGAAKPQTIELKGTSEQAINQVSNYILQMRSSNMDSAQVYFKHNELGDIKIMAEKMRGKDEILVSIQTSQAGTQQMFKEHQGDIVRALHDGGFKMADVRITQMPVAASSEMSKNSEGGDFSRDFSRDQSQSSGFGKEGQSGQFERRQESDRRKNLWNEAYERMGA